mmetsp:Transcript_18333/g.42443  ORF Transcript_18333/g.42443 Transcript_18333/m.42443 type:complete len:265 (+) Transcript_18333:2881-3675(+)
MPFGQQCSTGRKTVLCLQQFPQELPRRSNLPQAVLREPCTQFLDYPFDSARPDPCCERGSTKQRVRVVRQQKGTAVITTYILWVIHLVVFNSFLNLVFPESDIRHNLWHDGGQRRGELLHHRTGKIGHSGEGIFSQWQYIRICRSACTLDGLWKMGAECFPPRFGHVTQAFQSSPPNSTFVFFQVIFHHVCHLVFDKPSLFSHRSARNTRHGCDCQVFNPTYFCFLDLFEKYGHNQTQVLLNAICIQARTKTFQSITHHHLRPL